MTVVDQNQVDLREAAPSSPTTYTRYLGDLSGGQAVGRILDRSFGLGGRGIAFYDFPAITRPKPYRDAYRARLDGSAWARPTRPGWSPRSGSPSR